MDTFGMNHPLETVFVPGCPNIKIEPPDRKPIKEEIFVADFPIIAQAPVQVKTEQPTDIDDIDTKYSTNFQSQNNIELPQKSEAINRDDSSCSNICVEPDIKEFKEESDKNEEPNIDKKPKKKVRKKRLRPCDAITMEPKFVCNICTTGFQRSNNYTIHMKKQHQIIRDPTPHACPNCPRKYEFEYELKRHMKKYKPLVERLIYPCPQCDRKFQTMVHVNRHIRYVHENARPFVCEECGEAVHTAGILKEHMLIHTDQTPFQCKECGKNFKQRQRLKRHMEVHGDKHDCQQCGKKLSSRTTLKKHLLVHTEGKPHKCEYCGRAFKLVKTLNVHLNSHTGNKTYHCEFCDKTFSAPSSRRQHEKKKHADKLLEQKASPEAKRALNTLNTMYNT
ncbi:gastrula zinc finger protein XlCGF46.1-like isoform X2 [Eurosta solidaginis]|uniref:gastrula zinc finger protein XlCGF46.1-like isoform X2 n=1 Tax=Eurosta solidaginis TaxID=178769 RepID=UPI003531358B